MTRAREQAEDMVSLLAERGAEAMLFPTIALVDPDDWAPCDEAIASLHSYDWVVFTSVNAVERFMQRLVALHLDARAFSGVQVAAVGPTTALTLEEHGLIADLVPHEHVAEAAAEALVDAGVSEGSRVLLPRAQVAREVLPEALRARGAVVDVAPVYKNVLGEGDPATLRAMQEGDVDVITFTSSSTVKNFVRLVEGTGVLEKLDGVIVASIGPVTTKTARRLGIRVDVEPARYTVAALVEAIEEAV